MTRRGLLCSSIPAIAATPSLASNTIEAFVNQIAPSGSDEARLVRLHDYVRDTIKFGWTSAFNAEKPEDTLNARMGFCQTKGMLARDLLRASGIEARLVFAEINADVLHGLIEPGTPMVDHAFVEAKLGSQSIAFDSYVVDKPLFQNAVSRCFVEGRRRGYGVHVKGTTEFPGFSQFVDDRLTRGRVWGAYEDIQDFLRSDVQVWNRIPLLARLFLGFAFRSANHRIAQLRTSGL